jgi:hypothetical protein
VVSSATGLARLLTDADVYERVRLLEADYETTVLKFGVTIFPGWRLVGWKPMLRTTIGQGVMPDAALVDLESNEWYVVELELASHSVDEHIRPQLERLRYAIYGDDLAPDLAKATGRSEDAVRLMLSRRPNFLCLVDADSVDVRLACREFGFEYAVAEPLKSDANRFALRVLAVPYVLRRQTLGQGWRLVPSPPIMGTVAVALPADFPDGPVTLDYEGNRHPVKEVTLQGQRFMLLGFIEPKTRPRDLFLVRVLDAGRKLFVLELSKH